MAFRVHTGRNDLSCQCSGRGTDREEPSILLLCRYSHVGYCWDDHWASTIIEAIWVACKFVGISSPCSQSNVDVSCVISAVWLNLLLIFMSMGVIAHSPPNFESAQASFGVMPGPVVTQKFGTGPLFAKVNGIMNMVFAYGGAMIFPEFMAEMRRPMDFWKAMVSCRFPAAARGTKARR